MKTTIINLAPVSRAVAVATITLAISSHAWGGENVGFQTSNQAVAACKAMNDQFAATQATGQSDTAKSARELRAVTRLCDEEVRKAFDAIRRLGSEYVIGGLGVFAGFEINTPMLAKQSGNISGIGGGAVFATFDDQTRAPGLRLVPLIGGALGDSYVTSGPQLVEIQRGLIIYFGIGVKSINDYSGTYAGAGFETRTPGLSDLNNRSSIAGSIYGNLNMSKTFAMVIISSTNAGAGTGFGAKALTTVLPTDTGAGLSIVDVPVYYGKQIASAYNTIVDSLASLVGL